jgi:hypothetical protein
LYNGVNSVEEVDSIGAVPARYAQSMGLDEPLAGLSSGAAGFYDQDGLGSVTSLGSTTGMIVNSYTYDSFGNLTPSSGAVANPFQHSGGDVQVRAVLRHDPTETGTGRSISLLRRVLRPPMVASQSFDKEIRRKPEAMHKT